MVLAVGSLVPAIFGLVGVSLGAVLTGALETARESRREKRRARAAARLVRSDLFLVSRILRNGIARHEIPAFIDLSLPSWRESRDLLANSLDNDAWAVVSPACSRIQTLADVVLLAPRWSRGGLKAADIPRIDKALTEVVNAYEALGPLAEDPRPYDSMLELNPAPAEQ